MSFRRNTAFFHLVSCCVRMIASLRACVLACLPDLPLPVRAARQRIGCGHDNTGAVAVPSMSYETVLYRDTSVCMNRTRVMQLSKFLSYTGYSSTFLNDAIVRVPHAQGSKPHPSTVLLHHLARGNHFTAGPPCHSP